MENISAQPLCFVALGIVWCQAPENFKVLSDNSVNCMVHDVRKLDINIEYVRQICKLSRIVRHQAPKNPENLDIN